MQKSQVTIKIVVFSVIVDKLKVFRQGSRLPSEIYNKPVSLDKFASKVFENNINDSAYKIFFEQLYTVSFKKGQMEEIDIIYYFLLPEHKKYSKDNDWIDINIELSTGSGLKDARGLTLVNKYDKEIISYAVQRLRWKIEYTNVVYSLLPDEFTLSQLQEVYEIILGKALDKRNFRKKILSLGLVKPVGKILKGLAARPAELFTFRQRKLSYVEIL